MINSHLSNGMTSKGTGVTKKTALKDVQNQNGSPITNHRDNSLLLGSKLGVDATRVCGNKRLTPERPSSPACHLSLASNGANEHIINARRRFELELGRGRIQNDLDKYVESLPPKRVSQPQKEAPPKPNQAKENNISNAPITMPDNFTYSQSGASPVTLSASKSNRVTQSAKVDPAKFISDDQQRTERFARLQKLLKQCDESNYSDYIQMLLRLSPSDLSRHAVGLEKRAIQLVIDEGKEINRGKMLNVLGKSAPDFTPLQTTQLLKPKLEQ